MEMGWAFIRGSCQKIQWNVSSCNFQQSVAILKKGGGRHGKSLYKGNYVQLQIELFSIGGLEISCSYHLFGPREKGAVCSVII